MKIELLRLLASMGVLAILAIVITGSGWITAGLSVYGFGLGWRVK